MTAGHSGTAKRTSRRRFITASGAASLAAVAGCLGDDGNGDGSGDGGSGDGTVELASQFTFMHQETQEERVSAINGLADEFTSQTAVESIEQRPVAEADLPAEISSSLAAGTLPTVAELPLRALHDASDALRPESAGTVIEAIGEDQFYPNLLELVSTPDGGYFSVPIYAWAQLMQYRPSKFEEMGLDEPEDWDTIMAAAEALHDPDNNQFGLVIGSERDQFTLQCFTPFALSNEARVFNADGEIVFDSPEMVEALEYYADLHEYTPAGKQTWRPTTPMWENDQVHLASSNTFALTDIAEMEMAWIGSVSKETDATFGECMSTTTFAVGDQSRIRAGEEWQSFLRGGGDYDTSTYVEWCHIEPGGFQPVLQGISDREDYQDHEIISQWPEEFINEELDAAMGSIQRFGFVDGNVFPEIGEITGDFLITDTIRDVIDGADAQTAAEAAAEEMRSIVE